MRVRDVNKEALVKAKAAELLVTLGFEGFSMQKLAKACGISPATLYIYYADKDDLILKLGQEMGRKMVESTLKDFDPNMSFADGLKKQWENRAQFILENNDMAHCFEVIKHSSHCNIISDSLASEIRPKMELFLKNAIENKELKPLPLEVYWCAAFGPLYNLLKFHREGKSLGNKPFVFTFDVMYQTLEVVLKGLKP
jgi:TetR/AcrR family transcriptional regulator, multidrug resistance operon repressor